MTYTGIYVYGDSFGVGVSSQIPGCGGYSKVGISMDAILGNIQADATSLATHRVIISTGSLNSFASVDVFADTVVIDPPHEATLRAQITALRQRNAAMTEIRIVCTGKPNLDKQLNALYSSMGLITVAVLPTWIGPDHLHPSMHWAQIAADAIA
jgi:cellulase/cellobiase CelA1